MRPSSRGLSSHGQSPAEEGLAGIAFGLVEVHIVVVGGRSRRHTCEGMSQRI